MARVGEAEAILKLREELTAGIDKIERRMGSLERRSSRTSASLGSLGGVIAKVAGPVAFGALGRAVFETGKEFEQLRVRLNSVYNDAAKGEQAFAFIKKFATDTPFQIQNLTQSFIDLGNRGFQPTERSLTALGNLAAQQGKDITTAVQAVTQAAFGEAEMLKQFGIVMRQEGDKVQIRFKGVTTEVKKTSEDIFKALVDIADSIPGDAMAAQMATAAGAVSNLGDAWANLKDAISRAGINSAVGNILRFVTTGLNKLTRAVETNFADMRAAVFEFLSEATSGFTQWLNALFRKMAEMMARLTLAIRDAPDFVRALLDPSGNAQRWAGAFSAALFDTAADVASWGSVLAESFSEVAQEALGAQREVDALIPTLDGLGDSAANVGKKLKSNLNASLARTFGLPEMIGAVFFPPGSVDAILKRMREQLQAASSRASLFMPPDLIGAVWFPPGTLNVIRRNLEDTAEEASIGIGQQVGDALSQAVFSALAGDETLSVIDNFGKALARAVATGLSQTISRGLGGGIGAGIFGSLAGALVGGLLSRAFSGRDKFDTAVRFEASINAFTNATVIYRAASDKMAEAAKILADLAVDARGTFNALSRSVGGVLLGIGPNPNLPDGGLGGNAGGGGAGGGGAGGGRNILTSGLLGSGIVVPALDIFVRQFGDNFLVAIGNLATGMGKSAQEAFRDALDAFARNLPQLIESGAITLAGIPAAIAEVLKAGVAQTFEELQANIQTAVGLFSSAVGSVRATIFTFFADLAVTVREGIRIGFPADVLAEAVKNEIRSALNQIAGADLFPEVVDVAAAMADFEARLAELGITGRQAQRVLEDAAVAFEIFNQRAVANVLGPLADLLERIPQEEELARRIRARADQAAAIIQIETSRVQLRVLKEADIISRSLFRELNRALSRASEWARDLGNFMGEAAANAGRVASSAETAAASLERAGSAVQQTVIPELPALEAVAKSPLDEIREFFAGVSGPSDPLSQLVAKFNEFRKLLERITFKTPEKAAEAMEFLVSQFQAAFRRLVEGLKAGVRSFRDQLAVGEFSGLFLPQRAALATDQFQATLRAALGGDFSAISALQGAAQQALQLGAQSFGTASAQFKAIRAAVFGGLDQFLAADIKQPAELQLEATRSQTAAVVAEFERRRSQSASHHQEMMAVLRQIARGPVAQGV